MTLVVPGASRFTELFDVPHSYTTFANNVVTVKVTEDGLLFAPGGGSSPVTTKGDLYTFSTVNARLPVGTDGWVLFSDSTQATGLRWGVNGAGSGITRTVSNISANTSAGATALTEYTYNCTGALTLTLPTAVSNTNQYTVKRVSGLTTVATTSAQTINGSSTATLTIDNMSLSFISNGVNWNVV